MRPRNLRSRTVMVIGLLLVWFASAPGNVQADILDCVDNQGDEPGVPVACVEGEVSELVPCVQKYTSPATIWQWTISAGPLPQTLLDAGAAGILATCNQAGSYYYWDIAFAGPIGEVSCSGDGSGNADGQILFKDTTFAYPVTACDYSLEFVFLNPGACVAEVDVTGNMGGVTVSGTTVISLGTCVQLP